MDRPDIDFGQSNREAPSSHNKTDARDGLQPRVIRNVGFMEKLNEQDWTANYRSDACSYRLCD